MIKYSSSLLGFYAEVENIRTKERFGVSTFHTPYGAYETDIFKAADLSVSTDDVFAVKPLFVEYSSTLEQAKRIHTRAAESLEQSSPGEIIRKHNIEGSASAQSYRAQKIKILRQVLNKKY